MGSRAGHSRAGEPRTAEGGSQAGRMQPGRRQVGHRRAGIAGGIEEAEKRSSPYLATLVITRVVSGESGREG